MSNLKPKGLTISIIFEAESANYGEGVGNVASLKDIKRQGKSIHLHLKASNKI